MCAIPGGSQTLQSPCTDCRLSCMYSLADICVLCCLLHAACSLSAICGEAAASRFCEGKSLNHGLRMLLAAKTPLTLQMPEANVVFRLLPLQAKSDAFDVGGWDAYGDQWRYFFDCMLAPVAIQAQSALERLPATATPRASLDTPTNFLNAVLTSWTAMVADITRGSREAAAASWQPQPASLFAYALAPQHGPVVRTSLSRLVQEYRKWTQEQVGTVIVLILHEPVN